MYRVVRSQKKGDKFYYQIQYKNTEPKKWYHKFFNIYYEKWKPLILNDKYFYESLNEVEQVFLFTLRIDMNLKQLFNEVNL
jgi:hypothetical protein